MSIYLPPAPVSYEVFTEAICRLARAAAHGSRQMQAVEELIATGRLAPYTVTLPLPQYPGYPRTTTVYGKHHLPHKSWMNLRKRLIASGFSLMRDSAGAYRVAYLEG